MTEQPRAKKRRVAELLLGNQPVPVETVIEPDEGATILNADGSWEAAEAITKQMPSVGIPLTILTGFLGAGKSTVLNYILRADHGLRIAVLINEFGAVDIDNQLVDTSAGGAEGDPIQLDNGCVCCTISNGFLDAVKKILARPGEPPHYFILETSGVADPKPIIDSVANTELRADMYVDQVLTVIDSSSWTGAHYDSDTAIRQLQWADTVLLSKTDIAKQDKVKEVTDNLLEIKPNTRILKSQKGYVPITALFDLDMTKKSLEDRMKADGKPDDANAEKKKHHDHDHHHDHHHHHHDGDKKKHDHSGHNHAPGEKCDHPHDHDHDHKKKEPNHLEREGFSSISFTTKKSFSLNRFKDEFMEELPEEVFRAKGLLWFKNYSSRFVFHWSGQRFNVEEDDWPEGVEPCNQLVIIGRNLDKAFITDMLENCVTRDDDPDDEEFDYDDEDIYGDEDMPPEDMPDGMAPEGVPLQMAMNGDQQIVGRALAPIQGLSPAVVPQEGMQLPALQPMNPTPQGPVQLPHINTVEGNGTEGTTLTPSMANNKLPALSSLLPQAPGSVPANAVAEPAVEAPLSKPSATNMKSEENKAQ